MATLGELIFVAEGAIGPVTKFIASQDIGLFTAFSVFVDYYLYLILPLSIVLFYKQLGRKRIASLVLSLLFLFFLVTYTKLLFHESRPCNEYLKVSCPADYAFPSGHTAVAFAFAFFALGTAAFPFYYTSAFFVALSRIYLGVHSLNDVVGGVVVGIFSYFISEKVVEAWLRYAGD
ncbi:MAG: phosphatase PAP2 family protein [Candidatus Micrarchaeota archaeon]|nr:phosphatase PAP2 family protein [Candidatus Micrarchaeota archaeon]